ncbi:hypothetical protein VTK26DRAFT_7159 [Humicola hyalothermophila]
MKILALPCGPRHSLKEPFGGAHATLFAAGAHLGRWTTQSVRTRRVTPVLPLCSHFTFSSTKLFLMRSHLQGLG